MKQRITISVEEDMIINLRRFMIDNPIFRNKSHAVEYAIGKLIKDKRVKNDLR
ncbi:hypothetical protein GF336_02430 [Candidatus Woesearchaeota archaeon]|nr:hypothetical protein [Candidatus Woesearchaeota archaeon]